MGVWPHGMAAIGKVPNRRVRQLGRFWGTASDAGVEDGGGFGRRAGYRVRTYLVAIPPPAPVITPLTK